MNTNNFTIIVPGFEFFGRIENDYLKFLERCARVCYKSEDLISEGSAERLLNKIVKEYEHLSVIEHESCIIEIDNLININHYINIIFSAVPLFSDRFTILNNDLKLGGTLRLSGNLRMWMELIQKTSVRSELLWGNLQTVLASKYPFFFEKFGKYTDNIKIYSAYPLNNPYVLSDNELLKHMCLTYKIICSRSTSHQLVRHRKSSFCLDGDAITELTIHGTSLNGKRFSYSKRRKIKDLFEMKKTSHGRSRLKLVKINCVDESTGNIISNKIIDVVYSGKKLCIEIKTEDNYIIKTTKDHLFYTECGWKRLEDVLNNNLKIYTNGINFPSKGWLIEEYINKNRTRKEIAKELKISDCYLGKYIKKLDIQKSHKNRPNRKPGHGKKGMFSNEQKKQISQRMSGENNPAWKGGITPKANAIRQEKITKELRKLIYDRDDYTCQLCFKRGGSLTLHHVVPIWQDISLIDNVENLKTLCKTCHEKLNGHEHEYNDYFRSLKPIQPRKNISKSINKKIIKLSKIIEYKEIGEIDTYDIIMSDPHHNFIANGFVVHNSQESQRYCNYGKKGLQMVLPSIVTECDWEWFCNYVQFEYNFYLDALVRGMKPEDARYLLPNCTKTEIIVTSTLQNWKHIIKHRAHNNKAQKEIREIIQGIEKDIKSKGVNI